MSGWSADTHGASPWMPGQHVYTAYVAEDEARITSQDILQEGTARAIIYTYTYADFIPRIISVTRVIRVMACTHSLCSEATSSR